MQFDQLDSFQIKGVSSNLMHGVKVFTFSGCGTDELHEAWQAHEYTSTIITFWGLNCTDS